ncbi:hypothetical protein V8C26DRAFT_420060 [Trichoderma gracile]
MPPKADADKQQQECWECLRRCLACDGRRPVCDCCRSAGIVCPGYEDRRPLTWVTPGNITVTRIRRGRTASTAAPTAVALKTRRYRERPRLLLSTTERESTKIRQEVAAASPSTNDGKVTDDDTDTNVESIADTHDHENEDDDREEGDGGEEEGTISRDQLQSTEVTATTRPHTPATNLALVPHQRQYNMPTKRQSVSCIPISLQQDEFELMEAVEYYNHHIYPIISSNQVIPNAYARRFDKTRVAELNPSNRHALISISIGFRILAVAQIHRLSINPRVVGPASDLWTSFFRHVGLAMAALNDEIRQHPKRYLANIFRSIHLIASSELFLLNSPHWRAHVSGFMAILQEQGGLGTFIKDPGGSRYIVLSFLVSCIVANTTSSLQHQILEVACLNPKELYSLFKVSIYPPFLCPPDLFLDILYINRLRLQLPTTSVIYSLPSCRDLKQIYRAQLFEALRTAVGSSVRIHSIYWPVVVAGVAASSGTVEEKMLVEGHLKMGINDPFSGAGSLKALAMLKRAWAFGLTEWNECFSEPNVILFS